jgi:erythromycin esterase-like protein
MGQKLDRIVGEARYVVYGEPSHFLAAVHAFAGDTFLHLVHSKGYRLLVFESAWGLEEVCKDFMGSDRTELTPLEGYFLNAFDSAPTRALLLQIRAFNRQHPQDPILIAGCQPEQPVLDVKAFLKVAALATDYERSGLAGRAAALKVADPKYTSDLDWLRFVVEQRKRRIPTYGDAEREQCLKATAAVEGFLKEHRTELVGRTSATQFEESLLHLRSFRAYVDVLTRAADVRFREKPLTPEEAKQVGGAVYSKGDAARMDVFQTLQATRYGPRKVFLWMHNWHAARRSEQIEYGRDIPPGTFSFTTYLAKAKGKELVALGGIVGDPRIKEKAPADALEQKFAATFGDKVALIDLRRPSPQERALPLTTPGSLWIQVYQDRLEKVNLSEQFDAVYYLPASKTTFEK